jgi:hypothetical protein
VAPGKATVTCPRCAATHHLDCWDQRGGCGGGHPAKPWASTWRWVKLAAAGFVAYQAWMWWPALAWMSGRGTWHHALASPVKSHRARALFFNNELGEGHVPRLVVMAHRDPEGDIRASAVAQLAKMRALRDRPAVIDHALQDSDPRVRSAGAWAAGEVDRIDARLELIAPMVFDPDAQLSRSAFESLLWRSKDLRPALPLFRARLGPGRARDRVHAAFLIRHATREESEECTRAILAALESADGETEKALAHGLRMRPLAAAVPALLANRISWSALVYALEGYLMSGRDIPAADMRSIVDALVRLAGHEDRNVYISAIQTLGTELGRCDDVVLPALRAIEARSSGERRQVARDTLGKLGRRVLIQRKHASERTTQGPSDVDDVRREIDRAARAVRATQEPDQLFEEVGRSLGRGRVDPGVIDGIARRGDRAYRAIAAARREADAAVRAAAKLYAATVPGVSRYEALRRVMNDLRLAEPRASAFQIRPEDRIEAPAGTLAPPAAPEYAHLPRCDWQDRWYTVDPAFKKLQAMPAKELPDGAILPVLLMPIHAPQDVLRDHGDKSAAGKQVLARFGPRLLPAILSILSDPPRYGLDAAARENAMGTAWLTVHVGGDYFELAARWPAEAARAVFRPALQAGWNSAGRYLPAEPWAHQLRAEFADSPYGPPSK